MLLRILSYNRLTNTMVILLKASEKLVEVCKK